MECLKCGAALSREDYCPACGAEVKIYKKIIRMSNMCYNDGLERARLRDLSGAALSLRKSLKYNKMNAQARNLLGLVYFEMGETVDALSAWVIGRSLVPENEEAERYLSAVQSNANKLEALNQTIKKYNQALTYCRQGSKDLALIQLKKVLNLNPRLIKGHQLLALLYMEEGKYDLAKKSLRNAGRIDTSNTFTLRYLREVNENLQGDSPSKKKEKEELLSYQSGNETIIRPASFKENSALSTILNILVGLAIGVAITWFLVVPSIRQGAKGDTNQATKELNETITTQEQAIQALEGQIEELKGNISDMKQESSQSQDVIDIYKELVLASEAFRGGDLEAAGTALAKVDPNALSADAKQVYDTIHAEVNAQLIVTLFEEGEQAYNQKDFETAVQKLQQVADVDETYGEQQGDVIYHLANSYRETGNKEKAIEYYQKFLEQQPGTQRARSSRRYLDELQEEAGDVQDDGNTGDGGQEDDTAPGEENTGEE